MLKFFVEILSALVAGIIVWFIGFVAFNYHITHYALDTTTKTDAIIALTGGRNRISEAVELLNKGLSDRLFISGVQKGVSLDDIAKRDDVKINTNREITIEDVSLNTVENAIKTNEWIKKNHIKSIRLVTSNYHIPRSMEEFKIQNKDLQIIIHPVYSEKVSIPCWKNWRSFYLIASEYNKFLYVYLKGKLSL